MVLTAIVVCYFLLLLGIGWTSRHVDSTRDYFVADKKLHYWVSSFSYWTTGESGWLVLGLTGMGFAVGLNALWVAVGEVLFVALAWGYIARKFKSETDRLDSITVPDYLVDRLKDPGGYIRIVSVVVLLSMIVFNTSAQFNATGKAFSTFFDIPREWGIVIAFLGIIFYTVLGGFKAVAKTDFLQGALMFLGLAALPVITIGLAGGVIPSLSFISDKFPGLLNVWGPEGWGLKGFLTAFGFVAIGAGFLGSPQLVTRFIATESKDEMRRGGIVAVACTLITDLAAVFAGMFGRVLFESLGDQELIMPVITQTHMPTVVTGFYAAVLLAAIMSTADSFLILATTTLVRDVYQKMFHPTLSKGAMVNLSRAVTVLLGGVAVALALPENKAVFWVVLFAWAGISSAFCPIVIASLFSKRVTWQGGVWGMIAGFVTSILWNQLFAKSTGLYEIVPGFVVSFIVIFGVSKLTAKSASAV